MANTSTMYIFEIALSDSDRQVYEQLKISVALHPSESLEFMAMRVLAYCLEYEPALTFTKGLADSDEPALWAKTLDGRVKRWIEVGVPNVQRLHRAAKLAERVRVYSHRNPTNLFKQAASSKVHRGEEISVITCQPEFLRDFSNRLDRRNSISLSIAGGHIYLDFAGTTLETEVIELPLLSGS